MSELAAELERIQALGESAPRLARDPVNAAMINNWVEALGVPAPSGDTAPEAMIQVWTMNGLHGTRTDDDPLGLVTNAFDSAGYTSVVATNCAQRYLRPLRVGEQLTVRARLTDVVGPKQTALGEGYFATTQSTWYVGDEPVAEMTFRILKFKPGAPRADRTQGLRPVVSLDSAFFWEGTAAGELRIQHCPACGSLRNPPGPMCPSCGADKQDWIVASGKGTVFSYVVHHSPRVPGKNPPFAVALVELEEGVRMIGELIDVDPAAVHIGMPLELALTRIDDELTLPFWRPVGSAPAPRPVSEEPADPLPPMTVSATPTFIVATALATRDFQDVHHDRDAAIARGSKDIFVNILTDTGLVQRYAQEAFPGAVIRGIDIRLGVPCYAYDTLTFTGHVKERSGADVTLAVTATGALGEHIVGTVELELAS
jgi:uncharacterized OB-fold protein